MDVQRRQRHQDRGAPKEFWTAYLTDRMQTWLEGNNRVTEAASQRLAQVVTYDGTGHRSDGSGRVRPSLIGGCVRRQALSFLGVPRVGATPDAVRAAKAMAGTYGHYRWQAAGLSEGFLTDIEVPVRSKELGVYGSADGVCDDGSVFELKTTSPRQYERIQYGWKPEHAAQLQAYMYILGARHGSLVYENRESCEWTEFRFTISPRQVQHLVDVIRQVTTSTITNLPDPLPACKDKKGFDYRYCDWRTVCRPQGDREGNTSTIKEI